MGYFFNSAKWNLNSHIHSVISEVQHLVHKALDLFSHVFQALLTHLGILTHGVLTLPIKHSKDFKKKVMEWNFIVYLETTEVISTSGMQ